MSGRTQVVWRALHKSAGAARQGRERALPLVRAMGPTAAQGLAACMSVLQQSRVEKWQCSACSVLEEWGVDVADSAVAPLLDASKPRLLRAALRLRSSWRTSGLLHARLRDLLSAQPELVWEATVRFSICELVDVCLDCYLREDWLPADVRVQAWHVRMSSGAICTTCITFLRRACCPGLGRSTPVLNAWPAWLWALASRCHTWQVRLQQ